MKPLDVLNSPWAIMPEKLVEIGDIYLRHARGELADLEAIEVSIGKPLENEEKRYRVSNGVAVIPVEGVIAKRMNMFMNISGGTSTQLLRKDLDTVLADDAVRGVLLVVDSPGGEVDGTQAIAEAIYEARGHGKPIYALADGTMASAAYWIGSAADKVFIKDDTTAVGSIGVVATHVDYSKQQEMEGVKVTEITAGKYKRIASGNAPLSKEGRDSIQEMVDQIYSVFVDSVAKNRGVDAETVLEKMADGRIFIGQSAIDAGLVDGKASMDGLIEILGVQQAELFGSDVISDTDTTAQTTQYIQTGIDNQSMNITVTTTTTTGTMPVDGTIYIYKQDEVGDTNEPGATNTPGEGEKQMDEKKVKEVLGLAADSSEDDVMQALASVTAAKKLSGGSDKAVVSAYEYTKLLTKCRALEDKVSALSAQIEKERTEHQDAIRQREAEEMCNQALAEGKISKEMIDDWALKLALESPREFDKILSSMPKLVSVREAGHDNELPTGAYLNAGEQIERLISLKRDSAKKSGREMDYGDAQRQVATEHPQLWQDYIEQQRLVK